MEMKKEHADQLNELKKLSYDFYRLLAYGKEPLTYSIKNPNSGSESQVEVNAQFDEKDLTVEIGFDTDFGGRFDKTKGSFFVYSLNPSNIWTEMN
jgi:hypothetical protein